MTQRRDDSLDPRDLITPTRFGPDVPRLRMSDDDRARAARHIVRAHTPAQIEQILTWADPSLCPLLERLRDTRGQWRER